MKNWKLVLKMFVMVGVLFLAACGNAEDNPANSNDMKDKMSEEKKTEDSGSMSNEDMEKDKEMKNDEMMTEDKEMKNDEMMTEDEKMKNDEK